MIIGITASHFTEKGLDIYKTNSTYINAIMRAGGIPVLLVPNEDFVIPKVDGILLTGGADSDPAYYGEKALPYTTLVPHLQDEYEFALVRKMQGHIPILGICRGIQTICLAFGGSLYQDIPTQYPNPLCHFGCNHNVHIKNSSILPDGNMEVNSFHHQCIKEIAAQFAVTARAGDNIIEAVEWREKNIYGVQWHPELMGQDELFIEFIRLCSQNRE